MFLCPLLIMYFLLSVIIINNKHKGVYIMKLYLSADIEGTCGIVNWDETKLECEFSQHYRTQMSKEIAAACDGATQSGVHEILVKDAHDSGRNINPNILPENVKILRGWTKDPLVMMAGIDESFDACIFTGYHSGATCNGNPLSHTMDIDYDYFKINDEIASEFTINAYIAAYYNVPVAFLSGDEMLCESAKTKSKYSHCSCVKRNWKWFNFNPSKPCTKKNRKRCQKSFIWRFI